MKNKDPGMHRKLLCQHGKEHCPRKGTARFTQRTVPATNTTLFFFSHVIKAERKTSHRETTPTLLSKFSTSSEKKKKKKCPESPRKINVPCFCPKETEVKRKWRLTD